MASYPISDIHGLTASAAAKLKSIGIRTTASLLDAARDVKGRKALAARTGLTEQQFLEWANIAQFMCIKGMGKGKTDLVRAAGVNTVGELTQRNPHRLAESMRKANDTRKLVRQMPSEKSIERLIAHARKLPLKITY